MSNLGSLYSTKVEAEVLDPRVDITNQRCEFRLGGNGRCYYPNIRLVNLGCTTNGDNVAISSNAGLYSLIKHIHLMDGNKTLSSQRFCNRYLAFVNLLKPNYDNESITQQLARAGNMGFHINDLGVSAEYQSHATRTSANTNDSRNAYLDLTKVFSLLSNISYLDTNIFKELKVVIEYDVDSRNFLADPANVITTVKPSLVVNEIVDDELKALLRKNFQGVSFSEIEHDLVQVPAVAQPLAGASNSQSVKLRVKGFDGKNISRLVMMKNLSSDALYAPTANTLLGQGRFDSRSCIGENVNFIVNGSEVFSGGLDTPAKRAMVLAETWGDINISPFSNRPAVGNNVQAGVVNKLGCVAPIDANNENGRIGQSDYVGFDMATRVNQLQVQFERIGILDANAKVESVALNLNIYAEVAKLLEVKDGDYSVKYM